MLTTMWLLSRMSTVMHGQCAALYKSLGATSMSTIIRTLVGVYAVVSLEIGLAIEALMGHSQPSFSSNQVRAATRKTKSLDPYLRAVLPRTFKRAG